MRRGAVFLFALSSSLLLPLACGSSSDSTSGEGAPNGGTGGSAALTAGGSAGSSGHAGHAGTASSGAKSLGGTSAAGTTVSGGHAGGPTCPPPHPMPLPTCASTKKDACSACACNVSTSCGAAWDACVANAGCTKALQCLESTCPRVVCEDLAGDGATALASLLACAETACTAACALAPSAGAGGSASIGGGGGASHGGGGTKAGAAGATGEGGARAGASGAGASAAGGKAGTGGTGGSTGGASGEGGGVSGGSSGAPATIQCDAISDSPSQGGCVTIGGDIACNPIDPGASGCSSSSCEATYDPNGVTIGFACRDVAPGVLCSFCDAMNECGPGLVCASGVCAKLCCDDGDCAGKGACDLTFSTHGFGICRAP